MIFLTFSGEDVEVLDLASKTDFIFRSALTTSPCKIPSTTDNSLNDDRTGFPSKF